MEKKLPGVFVNKIEKEINNNETVYYGKIQNREKKHLKEQDNQDIRKKIKQIFGEDRYAYKITLTITLEDKKITKQVIGYNNTNIITFDNEIISIDDIIEIERSKEA